ncbi:MAG: histidine kinase [Bryobacterales bacterium]
MTARLIRLQEEGYRKLARELHDVFGQHLAVLAMRVGTLPPLVSNPSMDFDAAVSKAREEIEALSVEMHELARQLHPKILDDLGLAAAVKEAVRVVGETSGIRTHFSTNLTATRRIGPDIELWLGSCCAGVPSNIVKHSHANSMDISLRTTKGKVKLRIADDGKGFLPKITNTRRV